MTKKTQPDSSDATSGQTAETSIGPVLLQYIGPRDAGSPRYGALVPGRCYQESDPVFAGYLVATHPDHWVRGE